MPVVTLDGQTHWSGTPGSSRAAASRGISSLCAVFLNCASGSGVASGKCRVLRPATHCHLIVRLGFPEGHFRGAGWAVGGRGARFGCATTTTKTTNSTIKRSKTMASERAQNLQDTFLNHVRKAKVPLTIFPGQRGEAAGDCHLVRQFLFAVAARRPFAARLQARDFHDHAGGTDPAVRRW